MTRLLVSVRDVEEAEAALRGGADLIDVKEPLNGALGKADDAVIRAIVARIAGRAPVSAALGEWDEGAAWPSETQLAFVKWGPALAARRLHDWRTFLEGQLNRGEVPQTVLVAYADWQCAQAPAIEEIVALACLRPGNVLLIDTHCKDAAGQGSRPTLLDWIGVGEVAEICRQCRGSQVRIALAGSLGAVEIRALAFCRPDWFAVRGAACARQERSSSVSEERVRELARLVHESPGTAVPGLSL